MKNHYFTNLMRTLNYLWTKLLTLGVAFSLLTLTILSTNIRPVSAQTGQKKIRVIYLIPSDKTLRSDYSTALSNALLNVQSFYESSLTSGHTFTLNSPIVETVTTSHTASWYSTNSDGRAQDLWFYDNVVLDGLPIGQPDNDTVWLFFVDATVGCVPTPTPHPQAAGSNTHVSVFPGGNMGALVGEAVLDACTGQPQGQTPSIIMGGIGHEIGHTLDLPHPPGCDQGNCTGGSYAYNSLMYIGYASYPNTYFLPCDKKTLLNSGFFNIAQGSTFIVNGRIVTPNGVGISGATVTISDSCSGSVLQTTTSDAFGNYVFFGVSPAEIQFRVTSNQYRFPNPARTVLVSGNLSGQDITGLE